MRIFNFASLGDLDMFSDHDVVALGLRLEKNGEAVYRKALETAKDPAVRSLLEQIAQEEQSHVEWFSELEKTIGKGEDTHILKEMSRSLADDFFGEQVFSLKDADLSEIRSLPELIEAAVGFEKDSILFYEMLIPLVSGPKTSETLDRIIEEEKTHIQKLEQLLPNFARASG